MYAPIFRRSYVNRLLWFLVCTIASACANTGKVKRDDANAKQVKQTNTSKTTASTCIKGRVVDEKGKGVAYVFVQTKPVTSPAITDQNGYYEFCHAKKNTDGSMESKKLPLPQREYVILVKKDGFLAKPIKVSYKGKGVRMDSIQLREKQFKAQKIQTSGKDKLNNNKLPSGITGSHPKGG